MKFRHFAFVALSAFALGGCASYAYVGADGGGYYQGAPEAAYVGGDAYYDGYYPYYYSGIWGYMDYTPAYIGYYGFGHPYYVNPRPRPNPRYYGPAPSWTPAHGMPVGGWRNYGPRQPGTTTTGIGVLSPQSQRPAQRYAPSARPAGNSSGTYSGGRASSGHARSHWGNERP